MLDQIPAQLAEIYRALTSVASGARASALIDDLRTNAGGSASEILWQALFADCLRVGYCAVMADGVIEDREIEALLELIKAAAARYAVGLRSQYGELAVDDHESARAFLDRYAADRGPFGRGARIRWPGLTLCRRAAELGEHDALQRYTKTMTTLSAEACRLGGVSDGDPRWRSQTDELAELKRILATESATVGQVVDRRVQAFLAPCRVFSAVQQASSIFENDPFDVEAVHRDARLSFQQLVAQATMRPYVPDLGQMLVVSGDSGAGKTHLLRGFRRHVQEGGRGFVVYAQLQSRTEDYSRYLLFHLVESLSRRYSEQSGKTGLRELAGGLLRLARSPLRERLEQIAEDSWDGRDNLPEYVNGLVNDLLRIAELESFDRDLLRVLVYALRPDPRTTSSVYQYLRCDPMNEHDRGWIGGVTPRTRDDDPHRMICGLARFAAVTQRALVVMVDQVDLAGFEADSTLIFRRAIDALYRIVSENPSTVAVVSCLWELYEAARAQLNRPALDRLEKAPPIAKLQINRSYEEIEAVVARRLSLLFAEHGTVHRPEQPVYPIPENELQQQENRRLRDVLEWCHQFQAQCAAAGKIINADEPVTVVAKTREPDLDAIAAAWADAIRAGDLVMPNEDDEILAVVAEAAKAYVHEMGLSLDAPPYKNGVLRLQMSRGEERARAALAIAVVNHRPQGGAFGGQMDTLRRRAKSAGAVPIAVRTLEFPRGRASDKAMAQLINMRGRGAHLDASTLRALVAFQRFQPPFAADRILAWKLRDRPISNLPAVIDIFDFDRSRVDPAVGGGRRAATSPGETVETLAVSAEQLDDAPDVSAGESGRFGDAVPAPTSPTSSSRIATSPGLPVIDAELAPAPTEIAIPHAVKPKPDTGRFPKPRGGSGPVSAAAPPDPANAATAGSGIGAAAQPPAEPAARGATLPNIPDIPPTEVSGIRKPSPAKRAVRSTTPPIGAPVKQLWVGNSTSLEAAAPIHLDPGALLRHVGIVDGTESARIAMAMNLVEQMLERGVPAILLDRTGEMTGYARPDWWQRGATVRARELAERIDVRLFTPGTHIGRPLSIAVVPDLSRVPPAEHERAVQLAAATIAAATRTDPSADGPQRLATLTRAIAALITRRAPAGLLELIAQLQAGSDELANDDQVRHGLVEDLGPLLGNADVFTSGAEPLTADTLLRPTSSGRVPLAIVHTGFLGDGLRLQSWMAQLIDVVNRELVSSASTTLRALLVVDDADLFLPGGAGKSSSNEPWQALLQRAGAAGLGLVLTSRRPGELDYRQCASIDTWFIGKTDDTAAEKMKPVFERRPLGRRTLSRLESGRFVMLHGGAARDVERGAPLIELHKLEAAELKALAAQTRPRARTPDTPAPRKQEPTGSEWPPQPQPR